MTFTIKPLIPFPALMIGDGSNRNLVITDLHIGWEIDLLEKGIHIPSQTYRIRERLINLIKIYNPTSIIFLGDVKHSIPRISYEEWKVIPDFFETILKYVKNVTVISGNHDGDLGSLIPNSVQIFSSSGIMIGNNIRVGLFHGHSWPSFELLTSNILVMGHIHPVMLLKDNFSFMAINQIWIYAKIFIKNLVKHYDINKKRQKINNKLKINLSHLIIMPSFNDLVGGLTINNLKKRRRSISPIFMSNNIDFINSEIFLLDGTYMGIIDHLWSKEEVVRKKEL